MLAPGNARIPIGKARRAGRHDHQRPLHVHGQHPGIDVDMDIPMAALHVVAVGPFLILELNRAEHADAAATHVTVVLPHLDEAVAARVNDGAIVVQAKRAPLAGPDVRLRHPDGLVVEYVEHRPTSTTSTNQDPCCARPRR